MVKEGCEPSHEGTFMNFDAFVNKQVRIQTIQAESHASTTLLALLESATNQGIIVSPMGGSSEKFSHRFYPWTMVHYLDLEPVVQTTQTRGNVSRVG